MLEVEEGTGRLGERAWTREGEKRRGEREGEYMVQGKG